MLDFADAWKLAQLAPIHMSEKEARLLYDLATMHRPAKVVEVGSAQGGSATIFLASGSEVMCVDPLPDSLMGSPRSSMRTRCLALGYDVANPLRLFQAQMDRCRNVGLGEVRLIRQLDSEIPPIPCDILFVDHDHKEITTTRTIRRWLKNVRKAIVFHDYDHPVYPGVKQAVDGSGLKLHTRVEVMVVCSPK